MISDAVLINTKLEVTTPHFVLNKAKIIFMILAIVLAVLIGVQVYLANFLATQGQKALDLELKIKNLQEINKDLKMRVDQKGSLNEILEKSKELGFKKPGSFLFVKENSIVADKM